MSKVKNGGLDQYGAKPFEQRRFGTAGVEGINDDMLAHVTLFPPGVKFRHASWEISFRWEIQR